MRSILLAALLLTTACARDVVGPPGAEPMKPLPDYFIWWDQVQRDAGKEVGPLRIRWYVVPESWYSEDYGGIVQGGWTASGRIYLARAFIRHSGLVKHELLHEWIYQTGDRSGDPQHKHPLFRVYTPLAIEIRAH